MLEYSLLSFERKIRQWKREKGGECERKGKKEEGKTGNRS
jgi:hypothetical protein